jgi:hypothetical protein
MLQVVDAGHPQLRSIGLDYILLVGSLGIEPSGPDRQVIMLVGRGQGHSVHNGPVAQVVRAHP